MKRFPVNENLNEVFYIVEKILNLSKQQRVKGLLSDLARIVNVFDRKFIKILTPKHMLQRLAIALAQVKAGNTSENLLNEIRQTIYSLSRAKEITKKVLNIMNSIKL